MSKLDEFNNDEKAIIFFLKGQSILIHKLCSITGNDLSTEIQEICKMSYANVESSTQEELLEILDNTENLEQLLYYEAQELDSSL